MANSTSSEAFVHARLSDGTTKLVGQYRCRVGPRDRNVGEFQYVNSWARNEHGQAFPLDPINLPLTTDIHFTAKRFGLFGALADTTPDRWGQRLVQLTNPGPISPVGWLMSTGDERVGCLAFSSDAAAPSPESHVLPFHTLPQIADAFDRILRGEAVDPKLERLYRAGRSLGGVRPKAVIERDGVVWIAKFAHHDDEIDQCAAEHATMRLASRCGMDVAETTLVDVGGNRRAVLVKRFDRGAGPHFYPTVHYLSALSILDIDDTSSDGSYPQIAGALRQHAAAHARDREELFRRMVFNVLCGNRDDHLKNHALLYDGRWRLSPAFDIVPQIESVEPLQAIGVGTMGGHPTIENCLSRCGEFGLTRDAARAMAEKIVSDMRPWQDVFKSLNVPDRTIAGLQRCFRLVSQENDSGIPA
ncbi:MAG TPA: HipA domain-containing protein [Xanthobacteraceae bacterium]|nr:HipA domain-containing protein [Xanthobacteraceae bacterium]